MFSNKKYRNMRKLILSVVTSLFITTLFVNAQDGLKGTWFAGGNISLSGTKSYFENGDKRKTDAYGFMPFAGYFVSPTVAVGGALGYDYLRVKPEKTNSYMIKPFTRKYWNITGNLYFYGEVALPLSFGNTKIDDYYLTYNNYNKNTFGVQVQLSPGFDFIINKWLSIEASFLLANAGYSTISPEIGKKSSSWVVNGNSTGSKVGDLIIGVKFLF